MLKPSHRIDSHRLGVRATSQANGICSVRDFLQRDGAGEPILGLRQDLFSIGDMRKMKIFESAGGALMCSEEALSQSVQFGAMNH